MDRFSGAPTDEQLSRFFVLGPDDLERADRARSEVTRLGYAVQLCTVRFLGAFQADPGPVHADESELQRLAQRSLAATASGPPHGACQ